MQKAGVRSIRVLMVQHLDAGRPPSRLIFWIQAWVLSDSHALVYHDPFQVIPCQHCRGHHKMHILEQQRRNIFAIERCPSANDDNF